VHAIHFYGRPVSKLRRSWESVRTQAQLGDDITPHALRHTAATWLMQAGVDAFEAAGFLSMSVETLLAVYGHHHPDFQEQAARAQFRRKTRTVGARADRNGGRTGPEKDPINAGNRGEAASPDDSQVLKFRGKSG
jgi:hypothetical protein